MARWGDGKYEDDDAPATAAVNPPECRVRRALPPPAPTLDEVRQLKRVGRKLVLRLQRDRKEGDDELRTQLCEALAEVLRLQRVAYALELRLARLQRILWVVVAFIVGVVVFSLAGCSGPAFVAGDEATWSDAGAGAAVAPSPSDAGAAGAPSSAEVVTAGEAGEAGAPSSSGGSAGGGAAPAVSAGAPSVAGGASAAPCSRAGWTASGWAEWLDASGGPAALALDGSEQTRWTGGAEQQSGQWFEVRFGRELELERLTLRADPPTDSPRELMLELDGVPTPALIRRPSPGLVVLELEQPRKAAKARVVLAAAAPSWWSVNELTGDCR